MSRLALLLREGLANSTRKLVLRQPAFCPCHSCSASAHGKHRGCTVHLNQRLSMLPFLCARAEGSKSLGACSETIFCNFRDHSLHGDSTCIESKFWKLKLVAACSFAGCSSAGQAASRVGASARRQHGSFGDDCAPAAAAGRFPSGVRRMRRGQGCAAGAGTGAAGEFCSSVLSLFLCRSISRFPA